MNGEIRYFLFSSSFLDTSFQKKRVGGVEKVLVFLSKVFMHEFLPDIQKNNSMYMAKVLYTWHWARKPDDLFVIFVRGLSLNEGNCHFEHLAACLIDVSHTYSNLLKVDRVISPGVWCVFRSYSGRNDAVTLYFLMAWQWLTSYYYIEQL